MNVLQKQFVVIGNPISHSLSPQMHRAMYQKLGLSYDYERYLIPSEADLASFVETLSEKNIHGFNITVPYKESILPFLNDRSENATRIGAVNTVCVKNNRLTGHNTDGEGFLLAVNNELSETVAGKKVVVLGAGGSARAIVSSLGSSGATSLCILNRSIENAQRVKADLSDYFPSCPIHCAALSMTEETIQYLKEADWVINTTSVGMGVLKAQSPITIGDWVSDRQTIIDIIYNPEETVFLRECRIKGAKTMNGLGMLAGQGALAFALLTGEDGDYAVMKSSLEMS